MGPRLGPVNLALVSIYFMPVWGHDALSALTSPYSGFENPAQTAAAVYFRELFNLGLAGLIRTASILAVFKLVIAVAFAAYLIEFARALAGRREPDRATVDVVLLLALVAVGFWMVPALTQGDVALIRLQATQFLLLVGAAIVITFERAGETATRPLADTMTRPLEHFPEKWTPVFREKMRPLKKARALSDSIQPESALAEARAQPLARSTSFRISPASLKAWLAAGTPQ